MCSSDLPLRFKGWISPILFLKTLGYSTHGLLDACTSYGTQLFWPFSNERISWNNISIVDPLFTIPVLILVVIAIRTKKRPKELTILKNIEKFIGEIDQRPPIYSAIKINGKRAYTIARSGKIPELKKRKVTIFKFILQKIISEDEAEFTVKCSKGTYIRSLARDLGNEIGVLGHISMLKREEVGTFLNNRSISQIGRASCRERV